MAKLRAVECREFIKAAIEKADEMGVPVSIAVVGPEGHIIAVERMDEAGFITPETAIAKAFTVAAFRSMSPRFPDGLSVVDVYGQWQGKQEKTPERLRSKMLIIDYPDTAENRAKIDAIRAAWKRKTGDQSVLRVTEPADVSF